MIKGRSRHRVGLMLHTLALFTIVALAIGCSAPAAAPANAPGAAAAAPTSAPAAAAGVKTVKIGATLELTGPAASMGTPGQRGLEMAVDKVNNEWGGITVGGQKYKLELVVADSKADPKEGVAQAERFMSDGIKFIAGGHLSAVMLAVQEVTQPKKVITFGPSQSIENLIGKPDKKWLFKIIVGEGGCCGKANYYPDWVAKQTGMKSIGLILPNDAPGVDQMKFYGDAWEKGGVKIVAKEPYDRSKVTDFYPILTKVKAGNPEYLGIGYLDDQSGVMMKQGLETGVTKKFVGISTTSAAILDPVKEKVDEYVWVISTRNTASDATDPKVKAWRDAYKTKYGQDATPQNQVSLYWYDPLQMLAKAMEKAGTVDDTDKISDALRGMLWEGVMNYKVMSDGLFAHDFEAGYYKGGKFTYTLLGQENLKK